MLWRTIETRACRPVRSGGLFPAERPSADRSVSLIPRTARNPEEISLDVASSKKASVSGETDSRLETAIPTDVAFPMFGSGIASSSLSPETMIRTGLGRTEAHLPVRT